MVYDPMGSTVKYARACEHLEAIRGIVETWSKSTTYETISEPDPDGSGLVHCWRYVAKIGGPEFPDISALLGDCLNNFRAVLDHTIPGIDIIDIGIFTGVGFASRVAQRSINDGASPFSSKNLSSNAIDALITGGSFGLLSAPIFGADGAISNSLLRARLGIPDVFGFFVGQLGDNKGR
jgi:hypothetical protein